MQQQIWELFFKTGNIETYLLLKQIENEQLRELIHIQLENQVSAVTHLNL